MKVKCNQDQEGPKWPDFVFCEPHTSFQRPYDRHVLPTFFAIYLERSIMFSTHLSGESLRIMILKYKTLLYARTSSENDRVF